MMASYTNSTNAGWEAWNIQLTNYTLTGTWWAWNGAATSATVTIDQTVWKAWCVELVGWAERTGANQLSNYNGYSTYQPLPLPDTPENYLASVWAEWADLNEEAREARLAVLRHKQAEQEAREQEQRRLQWVEAEANEKADQLLMSVLDDEQQVSYRQSKVIYLTSQRRKRYRLTRAGGVQQLDDDGKEAVASFCIHPRGSDPRIPIADQVAAKVLYLRFNEAEFERIAHRNDLRAFRRPDEVARPAAAA